MSVLPREGYEYLGAGEVNRETTSLGPARRTEGPDDDKIVALFPGGIIASDATGDLANAPLAPLILKDVAPGLHVTIPADALSVAYDATDFSTHFGPPNYWVTNVPHRSADKGPWEGAGPSGFTWRFTLKVYGPQYQVLSEPNSSEAMDAYRSARQYSDSSRKRAVADIGVQLDNWRAVYSQRRPSEVVDELMATLGLGQITVARALGVTPTAVRKWRRGEAPRPEHRERLTRLASFISRLAAVGVHDPATWIDMSISDASSLTPLDLFVHGRADLAVLLGAALATPHEVLDDFDPAWRTDFAPDRDYEVVTVSDGTRSVVPRRDPSR